MTIQRKRLALIALALAPAFSIASVAFAGDTQTVPEIRPGFLKGYLPREALPDSAALLPPPPAVGSAAAALDQEMARESLALRDTPRWKLAAMDADLRFPDAAGAFSCALGVAVDEQATPRLFTMLRRVLTDAGVATYAAKDKYRHARPFTLDEQPICTPDKEQQLRTDGSYPSGHTAIGWAWALVLAEASPEQSNVIFARGLAFGENRIVCNVHWASDVIEGRTIGAATVAKLHTDPTFLADLAAAKAELVAARDRQLAPQRDCKFEAEALAQTMPAAP
ncbi:MAG TPA: phosphatase PAP2 family protein [Xanthobacteraceae bacterium]|nr:phosphatase PAP2 family protein [Xanthobacteraceae bacterium]